MNFRLFSLLGFLATVGAMGFALWLEHVQGLEPCPLCIFQRVAMIATGLVFLLAALHGPRGTGRWVYALLVWLSAGAGMAIAGRHVWLQSLPEDQVPACGPTLDFLTDSLPLWDVVATVLRGDGNCAVIDAAWLGISLPAWTLIGFVGLVLWAGVALLATRPDNR
ncbi:disulfide bond formation protein B [Algiphilus aromaticivorans]|jgi:disulfide bond formation protein DsbB|uniref:disulfide bond formation protein B n=1 Tax=Algiphilus aromaticivorans TaxID=382454 RepID=UPI0005C1CD25|nr:disulfide bond formation protein B [Algiphilus aromaticivorans]